ncbi:antibiotic biosynthesis monooxygenase family protein [Deinococcus wulumuqiensis]|uniref:antibiotic biosynthesis monooxygenase family protein n=1 Tax=Deinococcus wulumuqiensis TaxID=980427 RepID=UPI00242FA90D|nr:antibiotic biosynthesis monooxygenase [Deinococcus wulumuqiensis]
MMTVMNRIGVKPEFAAQFEESFRNRAGLVDGMPGFIRNEVLRPTKPGDPYIVLTYWQDEASFRAWTESDAFKQGHARSGSLPHDAFTGRPVLELHEVFLSSDR